ncbi:MAG TPA: hypothetical protein VFS43_41160 [Polyangiaceae bacterium]|nr:hypothetical protein [Polyangiaceae bacterium]
MRIDPAPPRTPARPGLPPFPPPPPPRSRRRGRLPRRLSAWAVLASLAALGGCGGTLRVVRLTPASGELALIGNRDEAHAQAESYMRRQCPYGYDVLREGEVRPSADPWSSSGFGAARAESSDTTEPSEWHIEFRCRGHVGEAPAPPAAPVPKAPAVASSAPPPPAAPAPAPAASSAPPPAPTASAPSSWF